MPLDYRKAKHGGTEKEILAYEAKGRSKSAKTEALKKKVAGRMSREERISHMAKYMDKHGSRTEYDMRTGGSTHIPATMNWEDYKKKNKLRE